MLVELSIDLNPFHHKSFDLENIEFLYLEEMSCLSSPFQEEGNEFTLKVDLNLLRFRLKFKLPFYFPGIQLILLNLKCCERGTPLFKQTSAC